MSIYKKLLEVQTKLRCAKNQYNSFGKYSYRSCEDILESLKPVLKKVEATIFINDEIVLVGERYYIKATITFVDIETGESLTNSALAREEEDKKGADGSQITGATSSYARKYALNGMFAIDDTKDSDATNTHGKDSADKTPSKSNNASQNTLSEGQVKRLYAIAKNANVEPRILIDTCKKEFGIVKLEQLTKENYDNICNRLEAKANK